MPGRIHSNESHKIHPCKGMKKVCILTSVHPRYDTRIFIKQAQSLVKAGYDVTLIVADGFGCEKKDGIHIIDVGVSSIGRISRMTRIALLMYKKALGINAHIYHFHDPELITVGLLLKIQGKHVIYDVHEDYPKAILSKYYLNPPMRKFTSSLFEVFERFGAKYFTGIVPATPAIAKRFASFNRNIIVVQNFPVHDDLIDMKISWKKRSDIVAYIGAISALRGVKEMVNAIGLASEGINVTLALAGKFSSQSLKKEVECLDGWRHIQYLGHLPQEKVTGLLCRVKAGLVVFHGEPNHIFSQPNKLFEYMSAGIPVIASNFPLWRKIIDESNSGICIDPLSPREIAEAVRWIIEHPKESETMGQNGRKEIQEKYNWSMEEKKLLLFYESLL